MGSYFNPIRRLTMVNGNRKVLLTTSIINTYVCCINKKQHTMHTFQNLVSAKEDEKESVELQTKRRQAHSMKRKVDSASLFPGALLVSQVYFQKIMLASSASRR